MEMEHVSEEYTRAYEEAIVWWVERRKAMADFFNGTQQ